MCRVVSAKAYVGLSVLLYPPKTDCKELHFILKNVQNKKRDLFLHLASTVALHFEKKWYFDNLFALSSGINNTSYIKNLFQSLFFS
jgi:hypothetical protein